MKSNLNTLFLEILEEHRNKGTLSVDDVVDEIMKKFHFTRNVKKKDLERFYIKTRVESMLSINEWYSYKKNNFVALDKASIEKLKNIEQNMINDITSRKKTLSRIREREEQIGQMELQIDGSDVIGIEERRSIADILEEAANS